MRILANYGNRSNGNSYNVTFEQMGDVPFERAEETIDQLFKLAREAVQRQIDKELEFPPEEEVTIPQPRINGNNRAQHKQTDDPISPKQRDLVMRLAKKKRRDIKNVDSFSKQEASDLIKELIAV